jgi:hypothetical protein
VGGVGLQVGQGSALSLSPENKMPDLPGATDEPYDRRFVKWMIKNKVSWTSAAVSRNRFTGCTLFQSAQPRSTN